MFGFSSNSLNTRSQNLVRNVYNNFRNHPDYRDFSISIDEQDIQGSTSITITKFGQNVNKFCFYPATNGNIESIAIYGAQLNDHYSAISSSKNIFGLKVSEIDIDRGGTSPFVDVYIKDY